MKILNIEKYDNGILSVSKNNTFNAISTNMTKIISKNTTYRLTFRNFACFKYNSFANDIGERRHHTVNMVLLQYIMKVFFRE